MTGSAPAAESRLNMLLPALRRLDRLLEAAMRAAEAAYGSDASADPYRGLYISTDEAQKLMRREPAMPGLSVDRESAERPASAPLEWMQRRFDLTDFDVDTVLIALAPELDLRYERLYAYLQDDVTRRRPSVDLALNLLCTTRDERVAQRARFAADAPLICHGLLHLAADPANAPLLSHSLKLDNAAVRLLLGQPCLDSRLVSFCRWLQPAPIADGGVPEVRRKALQQLAICARQQSAPLRLYLQGSSALGRLRAAQAIAAGLDTRLLAVDLTRALAASPDFDTTVALIVREATLLEAVPYLDDLDALRADDRAAFLQSLTSRLENAPGVVVLGGQRPWAPIHSVTGVITARFEVPGFDERRQFWQTRLTAESIVAQPQDLDALAGAFRFTTEQIDDAVASAVNQGRLIAAESPDAGGVDVPALFAAARAQCSGKLGSLARKIEPLYTWGDIILPADQVAQLREICAQAKHRHVVFGDWGFDRRLSLGKGLNVLFAGPPGTGKTMAAEIIANELRLDLYKIDLSQVVSKYIGETEKNLSRIFEEARTTNAIIFFDEADALFGKRSEVRDAHDRYANIEIAYLLQKMEEYEGISILATNLRQNLDQAFTRRLSFSVDFPFPDENSRLLIWKSIWPRETPLDSKLDLAFAATQFKLSGGSVKNVALAAAFMAADENSRVGTVHVLKAVRREFQKMGKSVPRAEYGPYWNLVEMAG